MKHALRIGALAVAATWAATALAQAQAPARKPAGQTTKKTSPRKAAPPAPLAEADEDQRKAAELTHYGDYACEFSQTLQVARNVQHAGYVDVRFGKEHYTMKPVLSTTGALRLEDVQGRTLMIQIPLKSMLMDARIGRRLVDDCVHERQQHARTAAATQPSGPGIGIDPDKAKAALEAEAAAAAASAAASAAATAASAAAVAASAAAEAASAVAPVAASAAAPTRPAAPASAPR